MFLFVVVGVGFVVVVVFVVLFFFFFKQKTAYEIRLSLVGSEVYKRQDYTFGETSPSVGHRIESPSKEME